MRSFFLLFPFLWVLSVQSELQDLLSSVDQLFEDFYMPDQQNLDEKDLKQLLKRSYDLKDEEEKHQVLKRSLDVNQPLVRDKQGVFLLSNIQDVMKIPVKFPNDINVISSHNLLYITTLEANGTNPENELANQMGLFQYSSISGIRKIKEVPVLGGIKTAVASFRNTTFIISAEHNAESTPDLFQGSTVYKLVDRIGRVHLEKIQILNVIQPNDVQFWEYHDQLYLMIGTSLGNDSVRTGTLIYRWLGFHFDCLQVIPGKLIRKVTPFSIGSFMYLAIAYFQDQNGNPDVESEIFRFSLEETKFKLFQKLKTHGATDFSHFKFEDETSRQSEHFLVVANSVAKTSRGTLSTLTESVIFKFANNVFVPFQSFRLRGVKQWLPIRGSQGEFLLLASHSDGVIGFQYDGWRFSEVSLQFKQSPFGDNIQSMRTFQLLGDIFLSIADKSSYGNKVNLWKLSFSHKNDLELKYDEVEKWCQGLSKKVSEDDLDEVLNDLQFLMKEESENLKKLEGENLEAGDYSGEMRDELDHISGKTMELEKLLKDVEHEVNSDKYDSEIPIELGASEIASLQIKCTKPDCCRFKDLTVNKINGEDLPLFLDNVIFLDEGVTDSDMEFENVVVEKDLSPSNINGHPSESLVDVSSTTLINEEIFVNGTVYIKGDLSVNGLFNGVKPDRDNLLLYSNAQNISDKLFVKDLKVKNLKISGSINSEPLERLLRKPEVNLRNTYRDLNVKNLNVEGLVNEYNISKVYNEALRNTGDQVIKGDVEFSTVEANDVVVDSNKISETSIEEAIESYKEHLCQSEEYERENLRFANDEPEVADQYIVIVEGSLKAKDIIDHSNSTSLLDVFRNSYSLNDSLIESEIQFSNIQADNLSVEEINKIPVSSWVVKNSKEAIRVTGRKTFKNGINIEKEVSVDKINGMDIETFSKDIMKLKGDQVIPADLEFDTITCDEIETTSAYFGNKLLQQLNRLELDHSVVTDYLKADNLTIYGEIDSLSWNDLIKDSVLKAEEEVSGEKTIKGNIQVESLNVSGNLNDLMFQDFMTLTSSDANKIVLDSNVTVPGHLSVEELHFEGMLDSTLKPRFEHDWLLQNDTQIITGPVTFENLEMKAGSKLMNETVNNINLRKLYSKSLKIDEDTIIKHLFTMDKIRADRIEVGGTLNGADFRRSVLRSKSKEPQEISGEWLLGQGIKVEGSLIIEGFLSGLNLTKLCEEKETEKISLIVEGSLHLPKEPVVRFTTNGVNIPSKIQEVWMKNENTTLKGQNIEFENIELLNKASLGGKMNNVNLTELSKFYLSKTKNRVISADYKFDKLIVRKSCRMRTAKVGGTVNGVNLTHWANNVLLQDEEQTILAPHKFDIFQTTDLELNGKVNGLDLGKDVLRMDVEDAVVEGEKTFHSVSVYDLQMPEGKTVQGVDIDFWRKNQVKRDGGVVITGNLTLKNAHFEGPVQVNGKVNNIHFDNEHLLTTSGNQVVTGIKKFVSPKDSTHPMKIQYFEVYGLIGDVDFDKLRKNQAYANQDLIFTQPKTFTQGLQADSMEIDGVYNGIDITQMCNYAFNPVDVNVRKEDFNVLMNQTRDLIQVLKGRAFFFDYFELIQTLKPNIKSVVPTMGAEGHYLLTVFTPTMMRFMEWNKFSETFTNRDEGLTIIDNITFVTSELSPNSSLLYIESSKSTRIFQSQSLKEIQASDTSCVVSFYLKPLEKSCIFIGQRRNSSRIMCNSVLMNDLQTYQWLDSKGSVQATAITIAGNVYVAVINKEEVFDKIENTLMIYRFDSTLQHFHVTHTLAEVNPVAVSSIQYKNDYYLVSAGGHLPESVHNSVLSIFKFSKRHKVFIRSQSIRVDTPVDVHFALLPSSELALYVLTSNPTKPFVVFLHKGISGFVEETSGLSLYPGSNLYSFTDSHNDHFVVISGFGKGQILKAGFKGDKPTQ